jgi:hypothetical protein
MAQVTKVKEGQTKTGKPMKTITLNEKVFGKDLLNVFEGHLRYNDMVVGAIISEGELELNNGFLNLKDTSYVARKMPQKQTIGESVEKAQIHKDVSIKTSSTQRDAVMIVTALVNQGHYKDRGNDPMIIKSDIEMWRKHLWKNWEFTEDTYFPPTDRYEPTEEEISPDDVVGF